MSINQKDARDSYKRNESLITRFILLVAIIYGLFYLYS
jgi:hypothetical protein